MVGRWVLRGSLERSLGGGPKDRNENLGGDGKGKEGEAAEMGWAGMGWELGAGSWELGAGSWARVRVRVRARARNNGSERIKCRLLVRWGEYRDKRGGRVGRGLFGVWIGGF
jgi:hypothetical protein